MAMKEIVIDINPTGKTEAMHFDEFPLGFLGPMSVDRASEIFHNPDTQQWDVVLPGHDMAHPVASGFTGYDVARAFEVEWLQGCRKAGFGLVTMEGMQIALELREGDSRALRNDTAYYEFYQRKVLNYQNAGPEYGDGPGFEGYEQRVPECGCSADCGDCNEVADCS
jgi:hypothetical protein